MAWKRISTLLAIGHIKSLQADDNDQEFVSCLWGLKFQVQVVASRYWLSMCQRETILVVAGVC